MKLGTLLDSTSRVVTPVRRTLRSMLRVCWLPTIACTLLSASAAEPGKADGNPYEKWAKGPPSDPGFFPLAVWLQARANAERYRKDGFNTYAGLWSGLTEEHLATVEKAQGRFRNSPKEERGRPVRA